MRILENGKEKDIQAIWLENKEEGIVKMIDQRVLPWKLEYYESKGWKKTAEAISKMVTRGAPNVGVTGAYAFYQASLESLKESDFIHALKTKAAKIKDARPTAVNLKNEVNKMLELVHKMEQKGSKNTEIVKKLGDHVERITQREVNANRKIGEYGSKLLNEGDAVLTHCNAGALATIDYGTALSPIRVAKEQGKKVTVFVDETRPWLQGARLTTWELKMANISHKLISDNAAGLLMSKGKIDAVIVGTDRVAMNGDVCNKIGTYKLALAAKDNDVPFYVAAPLSSFDRDLESGDNIPIEERAAEEVTWIRGATDTGEIKKVRVAPEKTEVVNPVFDITPSKYVSRLITEKGIFKPHEISEKIS